MKRLDHSRAAPCYACRIYRLFHPTNQFRLDASRIRCRICGCVALDLDNLCIYPCSNSSAACCVCHLPRPLGLRSGDALIGLGAAISRPITEYAIAIRNAWPAQMARGHTHDCDSYNRGGKFTHRNSYRFFCQTRTQPQRAKSTSNSVMLFISEPSSRDQVSAAHRRALWAL